ncbi:Endothelial differentiation- factor 1 [Binucleata daphniae]
MPQNFDTRVIKITKTNTSYKKEARVNEDEIEVVVVPKTISKLIVKLRSEQNMNQKDLQTKANIAAKILSDWENGKGIWNVKTAEKICKALKIELKELEKLVKEK